MPNRKSKPKTKKKTPIQKKFYDNKKIRKSALTKQELSSKHIEEYKALKQNLRKSFQKDENSRIPLKTFIQLKTIQEQLLKFSESAGFSQFDENQSNELLVTLDEVNILLNNETTHQQANNNSLFFESNKNKKSKKKIKVKQINSDSEQETEKEEQEEQKTTPIIFKPVMVMPSEKGLKSFKYLKAGTKDDQSSRLNLFAKECEDAGKKTGAPTVKTGIPHAKNKLIDTANWTHLFNEIQNKSTNAVRAFNKIDNDDPIKKSLLTVHSSEYIEKLIKQCASLKQNQTKKFNNDPDVVISNGVFEESIKELMTAYLNFNQDLFFIGLPSHHAYPDEAKGFCLLNKVAILTQMKIDLTKGNKQKFYYYGVDVNRDNGLASCLLKISDNLPDKNKINFFHYDVCDTRVYPYEGEKEINEQFDKKPTGYRHKAKVWRHNEYEYHLINLKHCEKSNKNETHHPAMLQICEKLKSDAELAFKDKEEGDFYILFGLDSHVNESAQCGTYLEDDDFEGEISKENKKHQRFTDADFQLLAKTIREIKEQYAPCVKFTIALEGGYDRKLIQNSFNVFLNSLYGEIDLTFEVEKTEVPYSSKMF